MASNKQNASPAKKQKTDPVHLWLRSEVKPFEKRTGLTPETCALLMKEGFQFTVEKFEDRCVAVEEYEKIGCTIAESGSWTSAPKDAIIVGLKELPEDGSDLQHRHIFFAHCFKNQGGWKELLNRFNSGGGSVYDLEFLQNDKGQRVAAFGFMAGFAGAAVGLMSYAAIHDSGKLGVITDFPNEAAMIAHVSGALKKAEQKAGRKPKVLIMGALGRCGRGAVSCFEKAGLTSDQMVKWDMAETKKGGPFPELLDVDIFVNCIYLSKPIPPFLTEEMLSSEERTLRVVVDVSCDTSNPHNPLPFCNVGTTFDSPIHRITPPKGTPVDVVAIDHLPTLLPLESSQHFANDLLPTMRNLKTLSTDPVWQRAEKLFTKWAAEAKK